MFQKLYNPEWKALSEKEKWELFESLICPRIPVNLEISEVQLLNFELGGIKNTTFQFDLLDETFLFIPGQMEVVLGWDNGSDRYLLSELLESVESVDVSSNYSREEIDDYINQNTTDPRVVDIPPLIVGKHAHPTSSIYIGKLDSVSGEYYGDLEKFLPFENEIREKIFPSLSFEDCLSFETPKEVFEEGKYYLEFLRDEEIYRVFLHQEMNFHSCKERIKKWSLDFLTPDEWEYVNGAGGRRLFRWGRNLSISNHSNLTKDIQDFFKARNENMFGVVFPINRKRYELTKDEHHLKMGHTRELGGKIFQTMLPLSSYYESPIQISEDEILSPEEFMYRKALRLIEN